MFTLIVLRSEREQRDVQRAQASPVIYPQPVACLLRDHQNKVLEDIKQTVYTLMTGS